MKIGWTVAPQSSNKPQFNSKIILLLTWICKPLQICFYFQMSISQGTTSTELSTLHWVLSGSSYTHAHARGGFRHTLYCIFVMQQDSYIFRDKNHEWIICVNFICLPSSQVNCLHLQSGLIYSNFSHFASPKLWFEPSISGIWIKQFLTEPTLSVYLFSISATRCRILVSTERYMWMFNK
jgi:hypothetical protein